MGFSRLRELLAAGLFRIGRTNLFEPRPIASGRSQTRAFARIQSLEYFKCKETGTLHLLHSARNGQIEDKFEKVATRTIVSTGRVPRRYRAGPFGLYPNTRIHTHSIMVTPA